MTPKIYHETIDKRFIEFLEAIGHDEFFGLLTSMSKTKSHEFYIEYYFNEKLELLFPNISGATWKLEVQFEVWRNGSDYTVSKDREFYLINLKKDNKTMACNNEIQEFNVINGCATYKGLTHSFDKWLEKFALKDY
jgi:hypothetical protein